MTPEQELVRLFGVKGRELDALRGLTGGVAATHLRTARLSANGFAAVVAGLTLWVPKTRSRR